MRGADVDARGPVRPRASSICGATALEDHTHAVVDFVRARWAAVLLTLGGISKIFKFIWT
jgi:hypothetical protein